MAQLIELALQLLDLSRLLILLVFHAIHFLNQLHFPLDFDIVVIFVFLMPFTKLLYRGRRLPLIQLQVTLAARDIFLLCFYFIFELLERCLELINLVVFFLEHILKKVEQTLVRRCGEAVVALPGFLLGFVRAIFANLEVARRTHVLVCAKDLTEFCFAVVTPLLVLF